jgi:hypothetical protein
VRHDHGQRGGVHEIHRGHVEDDLVAGCLGFGQAVAEPLARGDVEFAVRAHDHGGAAGFHREA